MEIHHLYPDGSEMWVTYLTNNYVPSKVDGPASISANGSEFWLVKGVPHRADGPSVISDVGGEAWYDQGKMIVGQVAFEKYWARITYSQLHLQAALCFAPWGRRKVEKIRPPSLTRPHDGPTILGRT